MSDFFLSITINQANTYSIEAVCTRFKKYSNSSTDFKKYQTGPIVLKDTNFKEYDRTLKKIINVIKFI